RGEEKPGEGLRVDLDAAPPALHALHDLLEPETHLLARPRERQGGRLVATAPHPRAEDLVRERLGRSVSGGELQQGQGERAGRVRIPRQLGELLCQLEQKPLGGRRPRQPGLRAPRLLLPRRPTSRLRASRLLTVRPRSSPSLRDRRPRARWLSSSPSRSSPTHQHQTITNPDLPTELCSA